MAERVKFASDRITAQVAEQLQSVDIVYPHNWNVIRGLNTFRDEVLELECVDKVFLQLDYDDRKWEALIVGRFPQVFSNDPRPSDVPVKTTLGPSTETNNLLSITKARLRLELALKGAGMASVFLSLYNRTSDERMTNKRVSELFFKSDKGSVFTASKKQRVFKLVA